MRAPYATVSHDSDFKHVVLRNDLIWPEFLLINKQFK